MPANRRLRLVALLAAFGVAALVVLGSANAASAQYGPDTEPTQAEQPSDVASAGAGQGSGSGTGSGALAKTGADDGLSTQVLVGVGLVVVGALAVGVAVRQRRAPTT